MLIKVFQKIDYYFFSKNIEKSLEYLYTSFLLKFELLILIFRDGDFQFAISHNNNIENTLYSF